VRAIEDVIAAPAEGRLAMTEGRNRPAMTKRIKAPHNDILSLVAGI